jgi:creatinine amidohydrolase
MTSLASAKYLYADLTWPEVNDAVALGKVILLPVGSTEQHARHLPLDVDTFLATELCLEAGRRAPDRILVAPSIPYGFNIHAMDFPGTMHVAWDHFIDYCTDVCKCFAYHGFKRIVIVNGHGSNEHLLEFVGRRTVLETDALVASFMWENLLRKNPEFMPSVREAVFPGGCGHACELETSVYLHLAGEKVQMDKAEDSVIWFNQRESLGFQYIDLMGTGPVNIIEWTSTYTDNGTCGQPTLATEEKGRRFFEEGVKNLLEFVNEFQRRPAPPRVDHHAVPPTCPLPKP